MLSLSLAAQTGYQPSPENLKSREWFEQARFGMFIHWGIYSVLGDGEWVMQHHHLTGPQYEQLAAQFYPVKFDAAQWVALAKQAGMRYIVVTSRHHDGFSMFATKQNKYNVVDATPYGKDVIRQLADECHRQGIKLFVYYSQLDWHHPDYYPLGGTGHWEGRPTNGQWPRYLDFMNAQLTELFTNYGELGGVWFDGMWDKPEADWQLGRTYALIHQLQPGALIVSNHHKLPYPGEDYADLREGPSRRQHHRMGRRSHQPASARNRRHHVSRRVLGLQAARHGAQELCAISSSTWFAPPATTPTFCLTSAPCPMAKFNLPSPIACARWAHG